MQLHLITRKRKLKKDLVIQTRTAATVITPIEIVNMMARIVQRIYMMKMVKLLTIAMVMVIAMTRQILTIKAKARKDRTRIKTTP